MHTPPHPGHSIKDACPDPLNLTVTEGARKLGGLPGTLSGRYKFGFRSSAKRASMRAMRKSRTWR
jgi:hypothetical protein